MTYNPKNHDSILISWPSPVRLFHDSAHKAELDAQVASQDYFALLATQLDTISQSLKKNHQTDYIVLEKVIDDLLYLHKHYQIKKS